ncbi:MAG TPA: MFS transporter [Candidatus Sulfotelmatobacter sp.]|nr:MFS transporter [Candidatus Sulfotelmatobacter sp.]
MRWRVAALVSVAIAISYLDRQTLPVAVHAISKDIPLSNEQFSTLQSAFLVSYAFMYAGGGKLSDVLGTKIGFTVIMIFWSLACVSHAFAVSFGMLAMSRFLLGMGEGGGFPAATRAVAEWFTTRERASAMGIINAGTSAGAVIAPPMIALILGLMSWRWIFVISGTLGLMWTVWWRLSYFVPDSQHIESQRVSGTVQTSPNWISLLRVREVWGLIIAKFLSDAAWYFYLFWLPKYLYDARGFDTKKVGAFAWIPYAAAGIGCLAGGWFSSYLIRRQFSVDVARKLALGLSAAVMPFILLVPHVAVSWAIVIFSVAYFGQQSWSTLVMVVPTDLLPRKIVGSVAGLVGFGGAMGGIAFGQLVGYLLDHGVGYSTVFVLAGMFHVVAFIVILAMIPAFEPADVERRLRYQGAQ